jgi:vanillate/3-O-methylgallate O-demethylase
MDELIVEGPDAARFLEGLAINSFANFGTNGAKHFVPVTPDGHVIGDMIMFREEENRFVLVGRAPAANWEAVTPSTNADRTRKVHATEPINDAERKGCHPSRCTPRWSMREANADL